MVRSHSSTKISAACSAPSCAPKSHLKVAHLKRVIFSINRTSQWTITVWSQPQ